MELLCPAGNLNSLKIAIDNGADTVYIGFKDETNARHFAGLNFNDKQLVEGVEYAHSRGKKVNTALNTFAQSNTFQNYINAVDKAADLNVDALIIADIALLEYATDKYPNIDIHLSVQASSTNSKSLDFYQNNFNITRAVLPRVLSLSAVKELSQKTTLELEVFAFGSLCIMAEGRCYLSSYLTGQSPNGFGACSPASFVEYKEDSEFLETRLNDVLIDKFTKNESAGYPTLCKGRFKVDGQLYHAIEEPVSLNTLDILPQLNEIGVVCIKIEGRQRSPAYIAQITKVWRDAIDNLNNFKVKPVWNKVLTDLSEGESTTLGAYHRKWK